MNARTSVDKLKLQASRVVPPFSIRIVVWYLNVPMSRVLISCGIPWMLGERQEV